MVIGASTISGLLGYGTYGYLKDKKKMSSWKAGAVTGAIGGLVGGLAVLIGVTPGLGAVMVQPKKLQPASVATQTPDLGSQFGAIVMNRLYGCSACGI